MTSPRFETVMAFDFGLKRIGVAFGQSVTNTASPVGTFVAKDGIPDWSLIVKCIAEWRPQVLVVGIPFLMDGSEQHITHCARKFLSRLQQQSNLPVHPVDERLTTRAARQELSERNEGKIFNHQKVDALAACLIAETWLSDQRNPPR